MLKSNWVNLTLFFSVFLSSSCRVYHPTTEPLLQVEKKGEVQIDGGMSIFTPGVSGGVAWAPTDNLVMQGSFMFTLESIYHYEGALGYYNQFGEKWKFAVLAGYRLGHTNSRIERGLKLWGSKYVEGEYQMPLIKVQLTKKVVGGGFGMGIKVGNSRNQIDFLDKDKFGTTETEYSTDYNSFVMEPSIMFILGGDEKFNISSVISCTISSNEEPNADFYQKLNVGFGLTYILGR